MKTPKKVRTHILLLDDDSDFQKLTTLSLWIHNIKISIASNIQEAKNAINQRVIDAALIELALPNMQGFQFLKWLNTKKNEKNIPSIAMTSIKNAKVKVQAKNLGAKKILFKPIQERDMIQSIREILKKTG